MYKLKLRVGKSGHEAWSSAGNTTNAIATAPVTPVTAAAKPTERTNGSEAGSEDISIISARSILALPLTENHKENESSIHLHQVPLPLPSFLTSRATNITSSKDYPTSNSKSTVNTARFEKNKQHGPAHDKDNANIDSTNGGEKRPEPAQKPKKPKKSKNTKIPKQPHLAVGYLSSLALFLCLVH
jgi:hypothetical protein